MKLQFTKRVFSFKHAILSMILFISLFILIYPEHYVFFPVSTIWLVHLMGVSIFFLYFSKLLLSNEIFRLIKYAFIIMFIGFVASNVINNNGDFGLAKRGMQIILFIFDAFWIIFLLKESEGIVNIYILLKWLVYITVLQAIISFIFFLVPSSYETYNSFVVYNVNASDDVREAFNAFRLMSVGDVRYATASVQYGLVMWAAIILRKVKYSIIGNNSLVFACVVTMFVVAGLLSGRTFFVFLAFTFIFIFCLYGRRIIFSFRQCCKIFAPVIFISIFAFIYILAENEEMISWMFELFINFSESGEVESASTNDLKTMYIFPTEIKTWVFGDGKTIGTDTAFYMGTDVGYLRSLYYWGIVGSLVYFMIQYKLYCLVKKFTDDINIRCYCLFILLWLIIYFFKDLYSVEKLMILFIITLIYTYPKYFCKPIQKN